MAEITPRPMMLIQTSFQLAVSSSPASEATPGRVVVRFHFSKRPLMPAGAGGGP
jgi:hypothetical protein